MQVLQALDANSSTNMDKTLINGVVITSQAQGLMHVFMYLNTCYKMFVYMF